MSNRISQANLAIDNQLHDMVVNEILPGLDISADQVWQAMATLLEEFQPRNQALLAKRADLQAKISNWHENNPSADANSYKAMLQEVGYLVEAPAQVQATTANVDEEISTIAGPQLGTREQRPLRFERRQRTLGQPLRCFVWHRCPSWPSPR